MLHTLYIPRVKRAHMGHIDYMKKVFQHQGIAYLKSVEFFEHEIPNAAFGYAIVKVQSWIPGTVSEHFKQRLQDETKETRIVFADPYYWIILPYVEKQPVVKIPPPPPHHPLYKPNASNNCDCICGCGGGEPDCSSQILYNYFTDKIWGNPDFSKQEQDGWTPVKMLTLNGANGNGTGREKYCQQVSNKHQHLGNCGNENSWTAMNSIEDNFRFYDTPFGFGFDI